MTREERLQWAKDRALEYWRTGDFENACASMIGDLSQFPEISCNNEYLVMLGIIYATQKDADGMQRWIEGFR